MIKSAKAKREAVIFLIAACALLSFALYAVNRAEERIRNFQDTIAEYEREKAELEASVERLEIRLEQIECENQALKTLFYNQRNMYQIIRAGKESEENPHALAVRGERPRSTADMDVSTPSGFTADMFERAFAKYPGMAGLGEAFVSAEEKYEVNAAILAGIVALESGWGTSALAQKKNNLAGLGASTAEAAFTFDAREDSIYFLAELLVTKYAPGGKYFGGSFTLSGINRRYAEDPLWAKKAAGCMERIVRAALLDYGEVSSLLADLFAEEEGGGN